MFEASSQDNPKLTPTCPTCQNQSEKVGFYACCLQPHCGVCYEGFHYFECKKKMAGEQNVLPSSSDQVVEVMCSRCDALLVSEFYHLCKQCGDARLCEDCLHDTHQAAKFLTHQIVSVNALAKQQKGSPTKNIRSHILKCTAHKKIRSIISENGLLLCSTCITEQKVRKIKTIDFQGK